MAQQFKGPLDYIDVATRIVEFREKYPEGRLRQKDVQFLDFAGKSWVVFTAEAWRTADDPSPAHGTAWEPVPGPTQFTRDSELQNAETAAWGRAMVAALAVDTRKGIASSEEVRNRQGAKEPAVDRVGKAEAAVRAVKDRTELDTVWGHVIKSGFAGIAQMVAAKADMDAKFPADPNTDNWAVKEIPNG